MMTSSHLHCSNPDVLAGLCALINAPIAIHLPAPARVTAHSGFISLSRCTVIYSLLKKAYQSSFTVTAADRAPPLSGTQSQKLRGVPSGCIKSSVGTRRCLEASMWTWVDGTVNGFPLTYFFRSNLHLGKSWGENMTVNFESFRTTVSAVSLDAAVCSSGQFETWCTVSNLMIFRTCLVC